jgi:hypothetical protein
MEKIGEHRWQVTQPTSIQIGKPASPPTDAALAALREAVASSGATTVYWFWCSIAGDRPHLGLGVAPADDDVITRVGRAVEPVWKQHSPHNPLFDVLRLGSSTDATIFAQGQVLYQSA